METTPKDKYVEETRSLTKASREMQQPELISVCGMEIIVYPEVFNPGQFFSSCWFAKEVSRFLKEAHAIEFCEIGSGTGIVSLYIAQQNTDIQITSCDVNPHAVTNTRENFEKHDISSQANVLQSDVFNGLGESKFDAIFWALPFGYVEEGAELDNVDLQTFDAGYKSIEEYFRNGAEYLSSGGSLLFGFSPEIGHQELIDELALTYGWLIELIGHEDGTEKSVVKMQLYAAQPKT
jgi:methylase of polypeptide subunit release factors